MPADRRQLVRLLGTVVLVFATTSVLLKAFDLFGRAVVDTAALEFASPNDLERAAGDRLVLPAYFPETLAWPPAEIRSLGGHRPTAAVLTFTGRADRSPRLVLAQTLRSTGDLPTDLLPSGTVLDEQELTGPRAVGRLARVLLSDGTIWHELAFERDGRSLRIRLRGPREELLRLAASVRREGP